jgi:hypothetical protein
MSDTTDQRVGPQEAGAKQPWIAPKLIALGDVASLTMTGAGINPDAGLTSS